MEGYFQRKINKEVEVGQVFPNCSIAFQSKSICDRGGGEPARGSILRNEISDLRHTEFR